tara:strand:+ start:99 stop:536 length:438 start_codon:yes stop_codon:yes gene_type:complete
MPCSICRQAGHNRQRCPILPRYIKQYDFTIVSMVCLAAPTVIYEQVMWKGLRVDGGALVGNGRVVDKQSGLYNRGLVKWWIDNSWALNVTVAATRRTTYVPLRNVLYCRANARLLNAFATKLQRWWRTGGLEELPMACPCAEMPE